MKLQFATIFLALASVLATPVAAGAPKVVTPATAGASTIETAIRVAITPLLSGAEIERITLSPHAGLYEVLTTRGMLYTDKKAEFVIFDATVVDTKSKTNLTARRIDELVRFSFADLPLGDAIKTVRGNGSRVIATFEDPNCGYCKKLIAELDKVDNVTVYTFLTPILSPDSGEKSKAIWCSTDRAKAWIGFMSNTSPLPTATECDTPIARNLALYRKLHITGTPALFYQSNRKVLGYVPAAKINEALAARP